MKTVFYSILFILLLPFFASSAAGATGEQSHAEIHRAVAEFVRSQTLTLPGRVLIKVDEIDRHVSRPICPSLEAYLPTGSQLIGSTVIGVRCPVKNGWSLFVPVQITVTVDMLISSKPLSQGHVLQGDDIAQQTAELTQLGILTNLSQALGKVLKSGVGAGQVLRQDMLRAAYVVTQGQTVQLIVEGAGFSIRSEGRALNNGAEGDAIQVKTASGQVISGVAKNAGVVEVRP